MDLSILNDTQLNFLTRIVEVIDDAYFQRLHLSISDEKRLIKLLDKLIDIALKKKRLEATFLLETDSSKSFAMILQFHTQIELIENYVTQIKQIIVPKEIKQVKGTNRLN